MQEIKGDPALGISVRAATGDGAEIIFQTHVAQDTALPALNKLLDDYTRALGRQRAKADLAVAEKNLKVQETQLVRMREDRARVEQAMNVQEPGRRLSGKDQSNLTTQRATADANEKRMGEIIRDARQDVTDLKAIIAKED